MDITAYQENIRKAVDVQLIARPAINATREAILSKGSDDECLSKTVGRLRMTKVRKMEGNEGISQNTELLTERSLDCEEDDTTEMVIDWWNGQKIAKQKM